MKSLRLALVLPMTFVASALSLAQGFVIDHWKEAIDVRADASVHVEERISVTFTEPHHGIFRNIPTSYPTGHGTTRSIFLKGLKVLDEQGRPITFKEDEEDSEVNVRIGDADVVLPIGAHKTYVIRYLVENAMNWFSDPDWVPSAELYWNATGNDWQANIRDVQVEVTFPKVPEAKKVRVKVFTGALGSRNSQLLDHPAERVFGKQTETTLSLGPAKVTISRSKPLPTHNGLTLVLDLPIKFVPKRKILEEAVGNSTDLSGGGFMDSPSPPSFDVQAAFNPSTIAFGLSLPVIVFLLLFLAWFLLGRDPDPGPLVVQFDPPDNLGGPECGAMADENIDPRDFASGIVSLAVKGHLRIHPVDQGGLFASRTAKIEVLESSGPDLQPFESMLLSLIAMGGPMVDDVELRTNVAPFTYGLREALYGELVDKGYYPESPPSIRSTWLSVGIVFTLVAGLAIAVLSPYSIPYALLMLPLTILIAYAMSRAMPRRSKAGALARQQVLGFKEFIMKARSQELDWMSKKHPDQAMFEKYLPHAVAFGLAKEWADAFKDVLRAMPNWYAASYEGGFSSLDFINDLLVVSSSMSAYALTPPRATYYNSGGGGGWGGFFTGGGMSGGSSGFSSSSFGGGGGFSGGGGGGGGGGSW